MKRPRLTFARIRHTVAGLARKKRKDADLNLPSGLIMIGFSPEYDVTGDSIRIEVGGKAGLAQIQWDIPQDLNMKVHGHCLSLYDVTFRKIAEAAVTSKGPVITREAEDSRQVCFSTLEEGGRLQLLVKRADFEIVERGDARSGTEWMRWKEGERQLTYLLEQPKTPVGRTKMVVVFSAIGAEFDFTYNYRSALLDVDAYRLYVLDDFGRRGAYYYADHRDEGIFHSIQEFLQQMFERHGIDVANVTFIGSSKGGTGAIIHGVRLAVGSIIVGAPQAKPGTYLRSNAPEMLDFIAGDNSDEALNWLDGVVERAVSTAAPKSHVRILVGRADHHYRDHALPLVSTLERRQIPVRLLVVEGVSHQEIGRPFSAYARQLVQRQTKRTDNGRQLDAYLPYESSWHGGSSNVVTFKLWIPVGESVSVKAFFSNGLHKTYGYSDSEDYSMEVPTGASVRFRVYRRSVSTGKRMGAFTTRWLRP